MPSGVSYNIDTSDMVGWTPRYWYCYSMPTGGTYNIDTSDMVGWTPTYWYCYSMPTGGTYNIDTSDMVGWTPTHWRCHSMPTGAVTISSSADLVGWVRCTNADFSNNGLLTADVDKILAGFWAGFASRTAANGTISVGGTNQAPTGTFRAANPPTTGKEFAYELLNDSQSVNPTKKWATVNITA
jgi:hypothetical protein